MVHISIKVHVPDQLFNTQAFEGKMERVLHQIAWEAEDYWRTIAGQRLKSSRDEYQKAIRNAGTATARSISIVLEGGFLPFALEEGTPEYAMNVKRGQIVPMNMNRQIIFTSPREWRTGTGDPWHHPRFPGFHMADDVIEEIQERIAPKYISEALDEL